MDPKTPEERKQALALTVRGAVARGGVVQSQNDFDAVVVYGKPVNHVLHVILTLATCLIWGIPWFIITVFGGEKREMITVDEWGNTAVQRM
jgi:hypothetical protein